MAELTFQIHSFVVWAASLVWGPYVLIPLLLGVGVIMMFGLGFRPWRKLGSAFVILWKGRQAQAGYKGELTPWRALMTSLAASVGTGHIVGVATVILIAGPGAVFWMWVAVVFGMAIKFCEVTLAVKYREVAPDGSFVGGPMYYIKNGLGNNWKWLGALFAIFGLAASFGIGNLAQGKSITLNLISRLAIAPEVVAGGLLALTAVILIGGVKRVGRVCGALVPVMAVIYVLGGLVILIIHYDKVPAAFTEIFSHAFSGHAAAGGFVGSTLAHSIRFGLARGLFSHEAGFGNASIAHATAIVKNPVKQGLIGMLEPLLGTIVISSITALVILVSEQWMGQDISSAAVLTARSFDRAGPGGFGAWLATIGLVLFAYSTILGWGVYGERCAIYLFGHKAALTFRVIFSLMAPVGCLSQFPFVYDLSDLFCGLMIIPNLIALLLLSPVVFKLARAFFRDPKNLTE